MTSDCMGGDQRETRARSVGRWWTSHRLTASRVFSGLAALSFVTLPSIVFVFKRGDHKAHYLTRANTNAALLSSPSPRLSPFSLTLTDRPTD